MFKVACVAGIIGDGGGGGASLSLSLPSSITPAMQAMFKMTIFKMSHGLALHTFGERCCLLTHFVSGFATDF